MLPREKIAVSLTDLAARCGKLCDGGRKRIALTSGCFDLLHRDHLDYLLRAADYGALVVGINSDAFVRRLKGPDRPIRIQDDRAYIIAGFECVRLVAVFENDTDLIRVVRPNVYVASVTSEIRVNDDRQRVEVLRELGTQIVELGSLQRDATTDIIARVKAAGR